MAKCPSCGWSQMHKRDCPAVKGETAPVAQNLIGIPNHGIEVDSQSIWCEAHRRVLRIDPNRRFDLACVRLFDHAVRDPRVQMAAGYNPQSGARADPAKLTGIIQAHSPLCCFLPGAVFDKVLRESYPGLFEMAQRHMVRMDTVADSYRGT